jgi:membrane protein GlpM
MLEIAWKGVVGGLITVLIVMLSKRGNVLPGILPLFPTFTVIALVAIGAKGDSGGFRETCVATAKTIPAYLAFLAVCYFAIGTIDYRLAIGLALLAWLVVIMAMLFLVWT